MFEIVGVFKENHFSLPPTALVSHFDNLKSSLQGGDLEFFIQKKLENNYLKLCNNLLFYKEMEGIFPRRGIDQKPSQKRGALFFLVGRKS